MSDFIFASRSTTGATAAVTEHPRALERSETDAMHASIPHGLQPHRPCMRPQTPAIQPLAPALHSSCYHSWQHGSSSSSNDPNAAAGRHSTTRRVAARAKPDRGSIAALEAAIGAINGILGAHSRSRQRKQGPAGSSGAGKQGQAAGGGPKSAVLAAPGPSKLISFTAKASGSVPVKVGTKLGQKKWEQ